MAIIRVVEALMDILVGVEVEVEVEVDILDMRQSLFELLRGYLSLTFLLGEMAIILMVVATEEVVVVAVTAAVATMVAAAMEGVEVETACQAWAKGLKNKSGVRYANCKTHASILRSVQDLDTLPRFEKSFYKEAETVRGRNQAEVDAFRAEKQMRVAGRDVPKPVTTFDEAGFPGRHRRF